MAKTLFEKIWNSHIVVERENEPSLIYIDRHLVHEVTSPQAFDGLRVNHRKVRRPDLTVATIDHNVPTTDRSLPMIDETSSTQIKTLEKNCKDFGIKLFGINDPNQGIVHVIGPQLGITLPGSTIVCVIVTHQLKVHLVLLLLVLEPVKLNTLLQLKHFGLKNQKHLKSWLLENVKTLLQ